jgi:hypothetical protein
MGENLSSSILDKRLIIRKCRELKKLNSQRSMTQ